MRDAVDQILEARQDVTAGRRHGLSVGFSLALHVGFVLAFILAPALAARHRPPEQFTRVQIVPVQALGVAEPRPVPARKEPIREPEPEPPPPAKTESEEKMAMPSPETEPPARQPAPAADLGAPAETTAPTDGPAPDAGLAQRRGGPDGSSLGTTPFGAQAGVDDPNFRYDYYLEQMLVIIGSHWLRPAVQGVEVIVHFRIGRDGELSEVEITQPSGSASFDLAGLRAVQLSSPLPPLPASYPHPSLGVSLVIR